MDTYLEISSTKINLKLEENIFLTDYDRTINEAKSTLQISKQLT